MRKLKTIVALFLCFALLTASAMAQGAEFRLSNVILQIDDSALDLSGIDLVVDFGDDLEASGVLIAIEAAAERLVAAAATIDGDNLILTSPSLSKSYKISLADVMKAVAPAATDVDLGSLISCFGEEDAEKLGMLAMQAVEIAQASIQDGGVVEYEGGSYQKVDFTFSDEDIHSLLYACTDILDAHPEIAQITGIESLHSALEDAAVKLEITGSVYMGDSGMIADVYLNSAGSALLHFDFTVEPNEQNDGEKILFDFYAGDREGEEYPIDGEICGSIVLQSGVFSSLEMFVGEPDDEGVDVKFYTPEARENGKTELLIETTDGNTYIDALIGSNGDGTAEIEFILAVEETTFDLKANAGITEAPDGWMPASKECVDILNMTEEDISTLESEGLLILLTSVGKLGEANPTIGSLITGSMLG